MYELGTKFDFRAMHRLPFEAGPEAEMHSHDYKLEVVVCGEELDKNGFLLDIIELRKVIDEIISSFREKDLNVIEEMKGRIPSLENLALSIWEMIAVHADEKDFSIEYIRVWENNDNWIRYQGK